MPNKIPILPQSRLFEKTLDLLRNRPITKTLRIVAMDTKLPESWLIHILCDGKSSPAVNRVEILYEYLSQKRLDI